MSYQPIFTISTRLLQLAEEIEVLRERIERAKLSVTWVPALQKDTHTRNVHASTAIEGNLYLEKLVNSRCENVSAPTSALTFVISKFDVQRQPSSHA